MFVFVWFLFYFWKILVTEQSNFVFFHSLNSTWRVLWRKNDCIEIDGREKASSREAYGSLCLGFRQCVLRFSKPMATSSYPSFTRPSPRASRYGSRILPRESWARAAWAQDLKCNLTLEGGMYFVQIRRICDQCRLRIECAQDMTVLQHQAKRSIVASVYASTQGCLLCSCEMAERGCLWQALMSCRQNLWPRPLGGAKRK